jgi:hypothetical protein
LPGESGLRPDKDLQNEEHAGDRPRPGWREEEQAAENPKDPKNRLGSLQSFGHARQLRFPLDSAWCKHGRDSVHTLRRGRPGGGNGKRQRNQRFSVPPGYDFAAEAVRPRDVAPQHSLRKTESQGAVGRHAFFTAGENRADRRRAHSLTLRHLHHELSTRRTCRSQNCAQRRQGRRTSHPSIFVFLIFT